jgi:hypothetical protein
MLTVIGLARVYCMSNRTPPGVHSFTSMLTCLVQAGSAVSKLSSNITFASTGILKTLIEMFSGHVIMPWSLARCLGAVNC